MSNSRRLIDNDRCAREEIPFAIEPAANGSPRKLNIWRTDEVQS